MFGIGLPELGVILVIALVIFGPSKLPGIGKAIGSTLGEFKKAANDVQKDVSEAIDEKKPEEKPVNEKPKHSE